MKLRVIKPKVALGIHHKDQKYLRLCRNYRLFSLKGTSGTQLVPSSALTLKLKHVAQESAYIILQVSMDGDSTVS